MHIYLQNGSSSMKARTKIPVIFSSSKSFQNKHTYLEENSLKYVTTYREAISEPVDTKKPENSSP